MVCPARAATATPAKILFLNIISLNQILKHFEQIARDTTSEHADIAFDAMTANQKQKDS
ncbi:hypothetical protein SIAM614_28407 [Stappia aggregata IAM 12614]|uniref:Uncharacterized protein n=1 Tax=Roseibium aggregatum (strain ATCC 25650 / DSM 13394 / JCM 20685 / NBRC 16684 / NCIMB 2208 / IAM 12614 / B1) TaxID=384765 RepID=A0NXP0_ROSAI|nr:hypothetical protein SIAM614_28407 [Stappia aggregata IAM 12614] [Roseibium aggregatum IAM 12614]